MCVCVCGGGGVNNNMGNNLIYDYIACQNLTVCVWRGGGRKNLFAPAVLYDLNISAPELQKTTVFVCPQFVVNQLLL